MAVNGHLHADVPLRNFHPSNCTHNRAIPNIRLCEYYLWVWHRV